MLMPLLFAGGSEKQVYVDHLPGDTKSLGFVLVPAKELLIKNQMVVK